MINNLIFNDNINTDKLLQASISINCGSSIYSNSNVELVAGQRVVFTDDFICNANMNNRLRACVGTSNLKSTEIFDAKLNISNLKTTDLIEIYPNPTIDDLNISVFSNINKRLQINIFNIDGKLLYNNSLLLTQNILLKKTPFSHYVSGVYFVKIHFDENVFTKKIIKN